MTSLSRRARRRLHAAAQTTQLAVRVSLHQLATRRWQAMLGFTLLAVAGAELALLAGAARWAAVLAGLGLSLTALCSSALGYWSVFHRVAQARALQATYPMAQIVSVTEQAGDTVEVVVAGVNSSVTYLDADCRDQYTAIRAGAFRETLRLGGEVADCLERARAGCESGLITQYFLTEGPFTDVQLESVTLTFPSFSATFQVA